jgi:hypothetical protein
MDKRVMTYDVWYKMLGALEEQIAAGEGFQAQ